MSQRELAEELAAAVQAKRLRDGLSLRAAAREADVGFMVLSRVEHGQIPDVENYRRIVTWLGGDPNEAFGAREANELPTIDAIAERLAQDPFLSSESRNQIESVVRQMYMALARPVEDEMQVHLRAARTFKPEAARLLADLLLQMRNALVHSSK